MRASFVRLFSVLLFTFLLSQHPSSRAWADSAADVAALNDQAAELYNQGKYAEAFQIVKQALALAE